jgi:hypothetical protein
VGKEVYLPVHGSVKAHYNATREERIRSQGGKIYQYRIYEYDVGEAPPEDNLSEGNPSSKNSEEPDAA